MPQLYPVNANTMNYAGPIMGGVVLLSGVWYMAYGVSQTLSLIFSSFRPSISLTKERLYKLLFSQWRTYTPAASIVGGVVQHNPKHPEHGQASQQGSESEKEASEKH